ncbi:MAG: hypothetical protein FWH02_08240 [Oscillospiraceae bacterium]|nr:hypothetical protein [Oscillospiraceae bacterium]
MDKSGIGIGSTSVVLIFAVLCLSFFALASYTSAENEMAPAKAEAALVSGYYEADALAVKIAAQLKNASAIPDNIYGVEIHRRTEESGEQIIIEFACPITDSKELYVSLSPERGILSRRMRDTQKWQPDTNMPVWPGQIEIRN